MALKIEIKGEIPTESVGRALDALTDFVRPITERLGLNADRIRLSRSEVLLKIAAKTRERLETENISPDRISLKTLIPLMEKASLEDKNDDIMVNLWANLLTSSAQESNNFAPRYVSILSEITKQQALLLDRIFGHERFEDKPSKQEILEKVELIGEHYILGLKYPQFEVPSDGDHNKGYQLYARRTAAVVRDAIHFSGSLIKEISVFQQGTSINGYRIQCDVPPDVPTIDHAIIESLGLVRTFRMNRLNIRDLVELDLNCILLTPLGIGLYSCCNPDRLRL